MVKLQYFHPQLKEQYKMSNPFAIPQIYADKKFNPIDNIPTVKTVTSVGDSPTILLLEDTLTVPVQTDQRTVSVSAL